MDGGPLDKIIVLTYFTNFNKSYAYSRDMEKVIFSFLNIVKIATFPLQHFIIFSQPSFMIPGTSSEMKTKNDHATKIWNTV